MICFDRFPEAPNVSLVFLPVFFSPLRNLRDLPKPEPEPARV